MITILNNNNGLKQAKCSFCNNYRVLERRYSGEHLCASCFINSVEKNIRKTISKYNMFRPQDKIIVALSGGKDSIALLYNIVKIQRKNYRSKPVTAISIDEGIKEYRQKSIKIASDFCQKLKIEHTIVSFKEKVGMTLDEIVNKMKKSRNYQYACNYCALIRRRLLNESALELRGDVLAIGHNLTDVAETFLMNVLHRRYQLISNQYLFKTSPPDFKRLFIKKIMPLMRIPEEEIQLYANLKKFKYFPYHCPYREQDPI
ncbi:MAG: ATP-binding protein, partial [Candidatus Hermodarchaeota archaeon]